MTEEIPQLLTLFAVAKALCVSKHTVRGWVRKGRLRPTRICRRLLFDPAEVARFLAAHDGKNAIECRLWSNSPEGTAGYDGIH